MTKNFKSFVVFSITCVCLILILICNDSTARTEDPRIEKIKKNFKEINSTKVWNRIDTVMIWETLEGGEMWIFYDKSAIRKLFVIHFGETGRAIKEYYIINSKLSFVFEKIYNYNRPYYYDSLDMIENNDDQYFDFDKSVITEQRCYFYDSRMIRWIGIDGKEIDNQSPEYREKEQAVLREFERLIKLASDKATEN